MDDLIHTRDLLAEGLETPEYTSAVYLIARHGKIAASGALGHIGDEQCTPTTMDSLFDLASLTKPIATATSLLILIERGMLHLGDPVEGFFPSRDLKHLSGITIRHLATHTSGLPAWVDMYTRGQSRSEAVDELLHTPLEYAPGAKYVYSCLGYIMLGLIIERVTGASLAEFTAENIFRPLGMADTRFNPSLDDIHRIVRTEDCPSSRRKSVAEVQDGNAQAMEGISGNAGMFSTIGDLAVYAQMLLNGGEYKGVRILSPESVEMMFTNRIDPALGRQSIGFFMPPHDMLPCEEGWSDRCAGHTGFTGTSIVIDPAHDVFVILLANKLYKYRDASDFFRRRRQFHNLIVSAVL